MNYYWYKVNDRKGCLCSNNTGNGWTNDETTKLHNFN